MGPAGAKADLSVGARATPAVVDWNDDGRFDLLVGALDGEVRLYLNSTDTGLPDLSAATLLQSGSATLAVSSGRSSVSVADLDRDGRKN